MKSKSGQRVEQRMPLEKREAQLLDIARELVLEKGLPEATNVKLSDVLAKVGMTTGSAYKIWDSQEDFQRSVALHLAESYGWAAVDDLVRASGIDGSENSDELVDKLASAYFDHLVTGDEFFVVLQLWSVIEPSDELTSAIQRGYTDVHESMLSLCQAFLNLANRKMRDPYDLAQAAVALTAITEGMALRYRYDPRSVAMADGTRAGAYADAIRAIVATYTEPK